MFMDRACPLAQNSTGTDGNTCTIPGAYASCDGIYFWRSQSVILLMTAIFVQ